MDEINYKFTAQPTEVEAFKMTHERRWNNMDWPAWLHMAWQKEADDFGSLTIDTNDSERNNLVLNFNGIMLTCPINSYIVRSADGMMIVMAPEAFIGCYESEMSRNNRLYQVFRHWVEEVGVAAQPPYIQALVDSFITSENVNTNT